MTLPPRKLINPLNNLIIDLASPINLSFIWNIGSLLGFCLSLQIITGLLLSIHYIPNADTAFASVSHIIREVNIGWALRNFHANGASIFFLIIYIHILRNLIFSSFKNTHTWSSGVTIYILTIATAFIGYLLPWGQIRFWGATVITNLFSAIPYAGKIIVEWLWGGFGVASPTLTRFFALHFILPLIIAALAIIHLIFLHTHGSQGPLGDQTALIKTPFHVHFSTKDLLGLLGLILLLNIVSTFFPLSLSDPENFIPANPLVTPTHIKPEWYFLWAYAILRSIPNKLGGVIAIFSALLLLYLLPMSPSIQTSTKLRTKYFIIIILSRTFLLLTWIGGNPVEAPFILIGQILTSIYFLALLTLIILPSPPL